MAVLNDMLMFMLSYALILVIGFIIINWLSGGFFSVFIKVKLSRGRLVFVEVKSKLVHYYVPGRIQGGFLVYHDRESKRNKQKEPKRLAIPEDNVFYRSGGCNCVKVDEDKNCLFVFNLDGVSGFDAIKWSNLLSRALTKPALEDDGKTRILIIVILIAVILLAFGLVMVYVKIGSLQQAIQGLGNVAGVNV
jgi:hypothetical protein